MVQTLKLCKTKGKVADLEERVEKEISQNMEILVLVIHDGQPMVFLMMLIHIHIYSNSGDLVIIHNGIIENYESLKKELINRGYTFKSDTDTEVLVNLN